MLTYKDMSSCTCVFLHVYVGYKTGWNLKPSVTSSSGLLTIFYLPFTCPVKVVSSRLGSTILGCIILTNFLMYYNYNPKIDMLKLKFFCFPFTLVAFLPGPYDQIQKWQTRVMCLIKKSKNHTFMSESVKSCIRLNTCFYQTMNWVG